MSHLSVRICSVVDEDLEILALFNKQLIEDEQHDNKMNLVQLKERMRSFITTDYNAYLFFEENEIVGYALVNHERSPLYLRQFFICRDHRGKSIGKLAFERLTEELKTKEIDIEVMYWNERGYGFWKAIGFKERSIYMRLSN
ncbi:GNAT family N-acetyltransferase [Cohnella panacarvi]|uniref:GNAT family N-acetyltransferase n=1 Tax=Cohnella panacarvi TaxID=400776 RepID=UPI00047E7AE0|nr:GNAT family N-acetyltransferase [Cohnella panacarvi]